MADKSKLPELSHVWVMNVVRWRRPEAWVVYVTWDHGFHWKQTLFVQAHLVTIDWCFMNILIDIVVVVELLVIVVVSMSWF